MRHRKHLFIDVETTGKSAERHALVQLALLVDTDGKLQGEKVWQIKPYPTKEIDPKALELNGFTEQMLESFMPPLQAMDSIGEWLKVYIDPFNPDDKAYPVGYNVNFDLDFLSAFTRDSGFKYLGSFLNWKRIDVLGIAYLLEYFGKMPKLANYKLGTVCQKFGIELEQEHDALEDIKATRNLFYILIEEMGLTIDFIDKAENELDLFKI